MEAEIRAWTERQAELRRLIVARGQGEAARRLFHQQHAATHSVEVYPGTAWSLEDIAVQGLAEDQIRFCPPKEVNSIAWLVWHSARIEDITLTALVLGRPQILDEGGWPERLGLGLRDVGTGMTPEEVRDFSARVNVAELLSYRAAVGASTRAGVESLPLERLGEIVLAEAVRRLAADGSISARVPGLVEFYTDRPRGWFLTRTATSHNFQHLNQAARLRLKLTRGH